MSLFYLNEHTSCYNYSNFIEEGFRYYKFDKGINYEERLIKDCILFVLKGICSSCITNLSSQFQRGKCSFGAVIASSTCIRRKKVKLLSPYLKEVYRPAKSFFFRSASLKNYQISHGISCNKGRVYENFLNFWFVIWKMEQTVYTFMRLSSKNCFGTFVFIILGRNRQTFSTQLSVDPRI